MEVLIHVLLNSELVGGEWLASYFGRYAPGETIPPPRVPIAMKVGVGPKAEMGDVEK